MYKMKMKKFVVSCMTVVLAITFTTTSPNPAFASAGSSTRNTTTSITSSENSVVLQSYALATPNTKVKKKSKVTPTSKPSKKKKATPTPTKKPTKKPKATATPKPTAKPKTTVTPSPAAQASTILDTSFENGVAGFAGRGGVEQVEVVTTKYKSGKSSLKVSKRTNTWHGAEIDLILELPSGDKWAIEIKFSLTPKLKKGFYTASADVKPDKVFIVYPGNERYPVTQSVEAISIQEICSLLLSLSI